MKEGLEMYGAIREIWDWLKVLVIVAVIVVLVRVFLFGNYEVHGESMMPNVEDGDRLIINKIGYQIGEPDRFDVIVMHAPDNSDFVKRIIGLPGDEIVYDEDTLYVNGEAVEEDFLELEEHAEQNNFPYTSDFTLDEIPGGEETVPDNYYFVLGDNRGNSQDSRNFGFVPEEDIVGEVSFRYWPLGEFSWINDH
ncbi:signal peptidase I [Salsuginibacillus kocurii]|uniref:signal peptidase I n=1 Tax=Salsuginibacillus kocurii TaxID=427078 RepID=UPI00036EDBAE|nr:signal peptidase I [Salsuginibacillus kocurii]